MMGCILPCRGHEVALGDNQKVTRQKKRRYNEINHVTSVSCSLPVLALMHAVRSCASTAHRVELCSAKSVSGSHVLRGWVL